jgi:hypothetical protein
VIALTLTAPAAHGAKRLPCGHGGITEARNDQVRVYELSTENDDHVLKACRFKTRKRTTLYSWFSCDCSRGDEPGPGPLWLGGAFVAVSSLPYFPPDGSPPATTRGDVELYDAKRGKSVLTFVAEPSRLLIKPSNGSLAYVEDFALHKIERGGADRVIDAGPIKQSSLTLEGSKLSWTKNGQRFSATLH